MAIGRRTRSPGFAVNDGNPFEPAIDTAWQEIQGALSAGDGHRAASLLERLRNVDRPVWNACHWRTDDWLVGWFKGRGLGRCEQFPTDEFDREALTAFLFRIYPNDPEAATIHSHKLPRILQELRVLGAQISAERRGQQPPPIPAAAPARVLEATRAVIPGALFDDLDD
jgi:hypothetical protein